jgi:hypothetical protein
MIAFSSLGRTKRLGGLLLLVENFLNVAYLLFHFAGGLFRLASVF